MYITKSLGITSITFRDLNIDEIIDFAVIAKVDGIEWGSDVHVLPGDKKSADERLLLVEECIDVFKKAAKYKIEKCFEYHRNSLTATKESAYQLMKEANQPNLFLYWQPNPDVDEDEKIREIDLLKPYLKTIHFFNWSDGNARHLMRDGMVKWTEYIKEIHDINLPYLLEFTKDDDEINALDDIEVMKSLLL